MIQMGILAAVGVMGTAFGMYERWKRKRLYQKTDAMLESVLRNRRCCCVRSERRGDIRTCGKNPQNPGTAGYCQAAGRGGKDR